MKSNDGYKYLEIINIYKIFFFFFYCISSIFYFIYYFFEKYLLFDIISLRYVPTAGSYNV